MTEPQAVRLDWSEVLLGAYVGVRRHVNALARGAAPNHGYSGDREWTLHIDGAIGELVVAKLLDRFWSGEGDYAPGKTDVAGLEVRTRSRHDYELPIRPDDLEHKADKPFVLVTGKAPDYLIHGWLRAGDARRDEWWHDYGGRGAPAYWVPQSALHPLRQLQQQTLWAAGHV